LKWPKIKFRTFLNEDFIARLFFETGAELSAPSIIVNFFNKEEIKFMAEIINKFAHSNDGIIVRAFSTVHKFNTIEEVLIFNEAQFIDTMAIMENKMISEDIKRQLRQRIFLK
jgi:hypothetical protein